MRTSKEREMLRHKHRHAESTEEKQMELMQTGWNIAKSLRKYECFIVKMLTSKMKQLQHLCKNPLREKKRKKKLSIVELSCFLLSIVRPKTLR